VIAVLTRKKQWSYFYADAGHATAHLHADNTARLAFFLALQQDQQVMRYVAEDRPQEAIREAFESRLPAWSPGSEHWLCLVVRDSATQTPLGVTGYRHHEADCAEVGFLFAPRRRERLRAGVITGGLPLCLC
jgi:hypothetical protein